MQAFLILHQNPISKLFFQCVFRILKSITSCHLFPSIKISNCRAVSLSGRSGAFPREPGTKDSFEWPPARPQIPSTLLNGSRHRRQIPKPSGSQTRISPLSRKRESHIPSCATPSVSRKAEKSGNSPPPYSFRICSWDATASSALIFTFSNGKWGVRVCSVRARLRLAPTTSKLRADLFGSTTYMTGWAD